MAINFYEDLTVYNHVYVEGGFYAGAAVDTNYDLKIKGASLLQSTLAVTGIVTLSSVANAASDPDKFLCISGSNQVEYRTGAEVLSDIGAVNGSGTANTVTMWSDADTLTDAPITISSNNVGIGTTSPGAKLDISAGTNLNLGVRQLALDNFSNEGIGMTFSRTSSDADLMAIGVVSTDKLGVFSRSGIIFSTGGSSQYGQTVERMRIDNSGNVGIGTTSPSEKLEVVGNVILDSSNSRLKLKSGVAGTNGGIDWTFNTDSTQYARIDLDYDNRSSDGLLIDSGYPITMDFSSSYIRFQNNGSEKMRITSTGNVGIGTTSPTEKLSLPDNAKIGLGDSADLQIYHNGSNSIIEDTGTGDLVVKFSNDLLIEGQDGANLINCNEGNSVQLYYNGSEKLETKSTGIEVTGDVLDRDIPCLFNSNFFDGTSSSIFVVPFNTLSESTVSNRTYYHNLTMPYAGKLVKVVMKNVSGSLGSGFTTQLFLYVNGSQQASSAELSISNSAVTWTPTSSNTFSAGDELSFAYQKSAAGTGITFAGVSFGVAIELTDYDI